MANPAHLEILKRGVEEWNEWRAANKNVRPDLTDALLNSASLSGAILSGADMIRADLRNANLREVFLGHANLINANLSYASLEGAVLSFASLFAAKLNGANLRHAYLTGVDLTKADLSEADLKHADLVKANFSDATLVNADFSQARMLATILSDVDLSVAKNLESVDHEGPSSVGIDTIYKSRGNIPEIFLRGCGLPEPFIVQIPALVAALEPIQFYSCFISYSSKNHDLAERLHADLQSKGVRCWFAPEDLKIGDHFRDRIDESIRLNDKLLIVLSENSVASTWVSDEVEAAIEREHREGHTVLFPIKIDEAVMESKQAWAATIRRKRHIGDFTRWNDHGSYQKAFDRLLRDLKAEEKKG